MRFSSGRPWLSSLPKSGSEIICTVIPGKRSLLTDVAELAAVNRVLSMRLNILIVCRQFASLGLDLTRFFQAVPKAVLEVVLEAFPCVWPSTFSIQQ